MFAVKWYIHSTGLGKVKENLSGVGRIYVGFHISGAFSVGTNSPAT
jgi:hypothetical protein